MGTGSLQPTQTLRFIAPTFNTENGGAAGPLVGNYEPPKLVLLQNNNIDGQVEGCVNLFGNGEADLAEAPLDSVDDCYNDTQYSPQRVGEDLNLLLLKKNVPYNIEFVNSTAQEDIELSDSLVLDFPPASYMNKSADMYKILTRIAPITGAPSLSDDQRWSKEDGARFVTLTHKNDNDYTYLPSAGHQPGFPSKLMFEASGGDGTIASLRLFPKWAVEESIARSQFLWFHQPQLDDDADDPVLPKVSAAMKFFIEFS